MSSVNNIETLRLSRGWSRPELGKRMNTSGQQVERLEKGQRKLTQSWIDKAAEAFGVAPQVIITPTQEVPISSAEPADDLHTGITPDQPLVRDASADDGVVEIIALDLSVSMGPGTLIEDFIEQQPIKFDIGLLRSLTRTPFHLLRIVKGVGDSMEPTLRTSDRIVVDTSEKMLARIHGVYWIDYQGAHALKRLRPMGQGQVLIMSDNADVPDFAVDAHEMRIHGRAIGAFRDL